MGNEDWYRRREPPVVRREFMRSRHEMDWAAQAYAIVAPVVSTGLGVSARSWTSKRLEGVVALRRLA